MSLETRGTTSYRWSTRQMAVEKVTCNEYTFMDAGLIERKEGAAVLI